MRAQIHTPARWLIVLGKQSWMRMTKKKAGTSKIVCLIAQESDSVQYTIKLTVKKMAKKSSSIALYKVMKKGTSGRISIANLSKTAKVSYKSSNKKTVTVVKSGKLRGKKVGKAVVTIKIKQKGVTRKYYVHVSVTKKNADAKNPELELII